MKLMRVLLLLVLSALAADAAAPRPGTNLVPSLGRELVLLVTHEKLVPECREDAGEFVQSVLQELSRKGYTVHLARDFVSAECN